MCTGRQLGRKSDIRTHTEVCYSACEQAHGDTPARHAVYVHTVSSKSQVQAALRRQLNVHTYVSTHIPVDLLHALPSRVCGCSQLSQALLLLLLASPGRLVRTSDGLLPLLLLDRLSVWVVEDGPVYTHTQTHTHTC